MAKSSLRLPQQPAAWVGARAQALGAVVAALAWLAAPDSGRVCAATPGPAAAPGTRGAEVEFIVDLRGSIAEGRFDAARDRVGVRGGSWPLSWSASLPAAPLGDGRYALRLRLEHRPFGGQPVQHKFVIERRARGLEDIWEPGRNHSLWLPEPGSASAVVARVSRVFGVEAAPVPARRTGTIERLGMMRSAHVSARSVQVWLPPGYGDDPSRRHAVLVLHDGQNVFDAAHTGAEWQFDETAQRLAEAGAIEAPIIVAVDAGPDRMHDYTPTPALVGPPPSRRGGGAAAYGRFLAEELLPSIARRYRTLGTPAATAVGGSSLGGLVSLWLAWHRPDIFGAALVVSPSLWWDDEGALREVLRRDWAPAPRPRLWMDMGGRESPQALAQARRMRDALLQRGWSAAELAYVEDPLGTHDEAAWAARVEGMLRFLYGAPRR